MRVTNGMLTSNLMRNLNNNLRKMEKYQNQLSTGKKIHKPSDDPVRASRALKLRTDLSRLEQYEKNANNSLSWMDITESAVTDVGDVLQRARELTVQAANGSLSTEDKQKIADEMAQLKKQLISSGNTNYAGRFIFSGYETDKELFDKDGNYNIDITSAMLKNKPTTTVEIGIGEDIQVSTNGLDIFGYQEINPLLQRLPVGGGKGSEATQGKISGASAFNLNTDFSQGAGDAGVSITIDSTTYTVNSTDLAAFDGTNATKQNMISLINNAENGGNKLSSVADAYFDIEGKLVIKSNSYGLGSTVQVDFTADTGGGINEAGLAAAFGIVDGASDTGDDPVDASIVGTQTYTDGDITNEAFEGTELIIDYNGEQRKVTLGALGSNDLDGLINAINTALGSAFSPPEYPAVPINAAKEDSGDGTNFFIRFDTQNSPVDGTKPELNIDVVRVKESVLLSDIQEAIDAMNTGDTDKTNEFLGKLDNHINKVLSVRADIGARVNRLELVQNRIKGNNITYTDLLSKNEDADMAEVIMLLQNQENVYRAALSTGAKVIQPTLIDFIR